MKINKGISLITLIITIVVIVILTGAIVLSINSNNPINNANEAAFKNDFAVAKENLNMILASNLAAGVSRPIAIEEVVGNGKFRDKIAIVDNTLVYVGENSTEATMAKTMGFKAITNGDGTEAHPYIVANATDLNNVRNDLNACYTQVCDIDLSSISNWEPIGNATQKFFGKYIGNNYAISNLKINRAGSDYQGLFGYIGAEEVQIDEYSTTVREGSVKNVVLKNAVVTGRDYVGSVVGNNETGSLNYCATINCNVTGVNYVGGLIGNHMFIWWGGDITYCYSTGIVKGNNYVGGLAGSIYSTSYSYTTCNVEGVDNVGGIAGTLNGGGIYNCMIGSDSIKITSGSSTNVGRVTSYMWEEYGMNKVNSQMKYISSTNVESATFPNQDIKDGHDIDKSLLLSKATYTSSYWAFSKTLGIDDGSSYPYLKNIISMSVLLNGSGTQTDPYIISSASDLDKVGYDNLVGNYYLQNADINLSSIANWEPIGGGAIIFRGIYDGGGHKINNLTINTTNSSVGLFGAVNNAIIKNIGLNNVNVQGRYSCGGIVGTSGSHTSIENCYVKGNITSEYQAGGICGDLQGTDTYDETISKIKNCYAIVNVNATDSYSAGITGFARGSVENCYVAGSVIGGRLVGSITGVSTGYIKNSIAIGINKPLDGYDSCHITSSTTNVSAATASLQSTYTNLGWNFAGTWKMPSGGGYPILAWE